VIYAFLFDPVPMEGTPAIFFSRPLTLLIGEEPGTLAQRGQFGDW
jgi:hypothetical protein